MATGHEPLVDDAPELARTMAALQRIAFGERAGQKARRIGSGFAWQARRPRSPVPAVPASTGFPARQRPGSRPSGDQLERLLRILRAGPCPWSASKKRPTATSLHFTHPGRTGRLGFGLAGGTPGEAGRLGALPRVHLVRYGGCLAPHSHLRGAIIPTPRQQGVEAQEDSTVLPRWSWARLLKRVFAVDMARCPWCQRGTLRIIAAMMQGEVIRTILRHLKLAVDPPHCSRACPSGSLCVVLVLTVPRTPRTSGETGHGEPAPSVVRDLGDCSSSCPGGTVMCNVPACWGFPATFQQPAAGPPPAVPSHIADGWCGLTVLRPAHPPGHPAAARVPHPVSSPHACAPVSRDMLAVPSFIPGSATTPRAPPRCKSFESISSVSSRPSFPPLPQLSSRWQQPLLLRACQRPPARASRWRGAQCLPPWPGVCQGGRADSRRGHQREQGDRRWADAGRWDC